MSNQKAGIAVVGDSMFAKVMAAELARNGASVVIVGNSRAASPIDVSVEENGARDRYSFPCSAEWKGLRDVDCVVTALVGEELLKVADQLAANMRTGQMLVMFPGYFMAESMAGIFLRSGKDGIPICEITSAPVVCDTAADGSILIHKRKNSLKFASHEGRGKQEAFAFMRKFLPMLSLASNTTETSLENINSVLHPLPILLNLAAVNKRPGSFRHFFDGVDENVSILMHLMDEERCAVGRSLGLRLEPVLDQLKSYYGYNEAASIYEYIRSPDCPYGEIRGFGLDSRYITLDVPNLVAKTCALARAKKVPTPIFDSCLTLAGPFLNGK